MHNSYRTYSNKLQGPYYKIYVDCEHGIIGSLQLSGNFRLGKQNP